MNSSSIGRKSRKKGKSGENDICRRFTEWHGGKFSRKKPGIEGADISCPPGWPFAMEVKNVASVKVRHLFKPNKDLHDFWRQTVEQAVAEEKEPMLVLKIEQMIFVCIDELYFRDCCMRVSPGPCGPWTPAWNSTSNLFDGSPVRVMTLDRFFISCDFGPIGFCEYESGTPEREGSE